MAGFKPRITSVRFCWPQPIAQLPKVHCRSSAGDEPVGHTATAFLPKYVAYLSGDCVKSGACMTPGKQSLEWAQLVFRLHPVCTTVSHFLWTTWQGASLCPHGIPPGRCGHAAALQGRSRPEPPWPGPCCPSVAGAPPPSCGDAPHPPSGVERALTGSLRPS